jgi:transcriptional regulator with XRE-family HTH domain
LLRDWRQRRRLSQLDLASEAEVSPRHLSFVETGRSKPSRELLLHLAEHLDVPLRERNSLLLAAGYAPSYHETPLDADEMQPIRDALDKILAGHDPYPAVVVDKRWDLLTANSAAFAILSDGVDPALLTPTANAMRIAMHPKGLAPRIVNFEEYSDHLVTRLDRQAALAADPDLYALAEEVRGYPGVSDVPATETNAASLLFVPMVMRTGAGEQLSFFSTLATFGTALDITVAELSIESFFPADAATVEALHASHAARATSR